jgi:hypothetical protein
MTAIGDCGFAVLIFPGLWNPLDSLNQSVDKTRDGAMSYDTFVISCNYRHNTCYHKPVTVSGLDNCIYLRAYISKLPAEFN